MGLAVTILTQPLLLPKPSLNRPDPLEMCQPQPVNHMPLVATFQSVILIFETQSPSETIVSRASHYILEIMIESISRCPLNISLQKLLARSCTCHES